MRSKQILCWALLSISGLATSTVLANSAHLMALPPPEEPSSRAAVAALQELCPTYTGVVDTSSVPVDQVQPFTILLDSPAPPGGVTYEIRGLDPSVVAAGNRTQGFFPRVTVPAGQSLSNPFSIYGIRVGRTALYVRSLTPGFRSFTAPAVAWDWGRQAKGRFLDVNAAANPCREDNSPEVSTSAVKLATCGEAVQGAVTDGLSHLLLRLSAGSPGNVCFEFTSAGPPAPGSLTPALTETVPVTVGGVHYAFGFYTPPDGFEVPQDRREVEVRVTYRPSEGVANTSRIRAKTILVRPPVVLVHGLWSHKDTWDPHYERKGDDFTIVKADYEETNAVPFVDNRGVVPKFVKEAIEKSRNKKKYATTQADLVAHSMGALLSRLYIQDPAHRRPDNFNQGDVRRLVTLTAPHYGSNLANLLIALNACCREDLLKQITGLPGSIQQGAICDLAENSPALQALAATPVAQHVISATGGPVGSPANPARYWGGGSFNLEQRLTALRAGFEDQGDPAGYYFPQALVDGYRFREPNDTLVTLASQLGGVGESSPVRTDFADLLHATIPLLDTGVTGAAQVAAAVWAVLDPPATSPGLGSGFGPVLSDGSGSARSVPGQGAVIEQVIYQSQCAPGGPLNSGPVQLAAQAAALAADPRVRIISPQPGQVFAPGDTLTVTVEVEPGLEVLRLTVNGSWPMGSQMTETRPYTVAFTIPEEVTGTLELTADAENRTQYYRSAPVTIAVRPTEPPAELLVDSSIDLEFPPTPDGSARVGVVGLYPNNVRRRLSSSAAGTTWVSSNPAVVQVDAEGKLTPTGVGSAVITSENLGVKAFTIVDVSPPDQPMPIQDVTPALSIRRSGFLLNRNTGFFVQEVSFTNPADIPLAGPLYAVISDLPAGVTLRYGGATKQLPPPGSPYQDLPLTSPGPSLYPGETLLLRLEFLNPDYKRINYNLRVYRSLRGS